MYLPITNTEKELYYYFRFIYYFLILFFVLGIIIIYKHNISFDFIIVVVVIYIICIFIQNNDIITCFYSNKTKEGWQDIHCFRIYSEYAYAQYEIDQLDISFNIIKNDIMSSLKNKSDKTQSQYIDLDNQISILLKNFTTNLSNVAQTNNKWNSQYATTLQSMNNITNSLYNIQSNLDPNQYSKSYIRV
jgi:hypothetical protein